MQISKSVKVTLIGALFFGSLAGAFTVTHALTNPPVDNPMKINAIVESPSPTPSPELEPKASRDSKPAAEPATSPAPSGATNPTVSSDAPAPAPEVSTPTPRLYEASAGTPVPVPSTQPTTAPLSGTFSVSTFN